MVAVKNDRSAGTVDFREAGLIRQAKEGDMGAFEALYRRYVPRVFGLCRRMVGEPGIAEEVTQDVFVRVWEKIHLYRGDREFAPWLLTLAANVVRSRWRSDRRRTDRESPLDDAVAPPQARRPSSRASNGRIDLERAIRTLPDGARKVFVLHDIEGYRHVEIAEMLGLATGTSKAQLHRARRMLREVLSS